MSIPHMLFLILIGFLALIFWNATRAVDAEAEANQEAEAREHESGQGTSSNQDAEGDGEFSDAYPSAGPRLMAVLHLMDLSTRLNRATTRLANLPDWEPFSDLGRERRIVMEQLRISQHYQSEALRHWQSGPSSFASSDAEWALTAANLSLSFAEKRIDELARPVD